MVIKGNLAISAPIEVHWIGSSQTGTELNLPEHLRWKLDIYFYDKCIIGEHTINVGDFVLVQNADSAEPDTVAGCDIGRILYLYESLEEMTNRDPYRAVVQWYSWPMRLPPKVYDSDDVAIHFDIEVIEEHRPYDSDISLETIYKKCIVLHASSESEASAVLEKYKNKKSAYPMFVCRYKFIKVKSTYRLVPLEYANVNEHSQLSKADTAKDRRRTCFDTVKTSPSAKVNSESARKSKRSKDFAVERKRRASVACDATAIEFVDVRKPLKENKVSPIKIIGGQSVVRLSASEKQQKSKSASKAEVNGNYLMASPLVEAQNTKVTPTSRALAARRNLNLSLDNGGANTTSESDCLNYSIVENKSSSTETPGNEIKIKLRLSERKNSTRRVSFEEDPLAINGIENVENVLLQRQRKRKGAVQSSTPSDIYTTPSKRTKDTENAAGLEMTPKTATTNRRKSILKSATRKVDEGTPKRNIQLSNIVEKRIFQEDDIISTPKRGRPKKSRGDDDEDFVAEKSAPKTPTRRPSSVKTQAASPPKTPSQKLKLIRSGEITPHIEERRGCKTGKENKSELQLARERLHVSVVPTCLPCREKEFDDIYTFLEGKIQDQCGGCMYVSGVPGTGKTATVTAVIRALQQDAAAENIPHFEFLEINGMRLTEPRQAYVQIYKQLTGKTVSWETAHSLLEKRFMTPAPRRVTTVLLVDELDILCNRRQDVVYNLLDWPTKAAARLVVVTIANTMDLPERLLMGKVTSRLGLTRLTFQPYSHKQLQEIVLARLSGSEAFKSDAVQLAARKVAAVSGDARRALDICRRATEIAESSSKSKPEQVSVSVLHVQQALAEMIASPKVQAIKSCSRIEQIFLQAVAAEVTRTGVEETTFMGVYSQIESIAAFMGLNVPPPGRAQYICSKLGSQRLLICEHSRNDLFQKILLNVSMDDIHFALRVTKND